MVRTAPRRQRTTPDVPLDLEQVQNSMAGLISVQKEMIKIMRATNTVMQAQSQAVSSLGDSAAGAIGNIEEVSTVLTRFIGSADRGFLRATSGPAGIFHKLMYGVPGYFIFKNRLDTVLSGIDAGLLKPLKRAIQGGEREGGFLNTVIYGVGGTYGKSKRQLSLLFGAIKNAPFPRQIGRQARGTPQTPRQAIAQAIGKAIIESKIAKGIGNFLEIVDTGIWKFVKSKGKEFMKGIFSFAKKGLLFFATVLLVFAKIGFAVVIILVALKFLVGLFKGIDGKAEFFLRVLDTMKEIASTGIGLISRGAGKILDGLDLIYSSIFGDGTMTDLLEGIYGSVEGILEIFGGVLLVLFSPILALIVESVKSAVRIAEDRGNEILNKFGQLLFAIGAIMALGLLIVAAIPALGVALSSVIPYIIGFIVTSIVGLVLAAVKPFANGGVTTSGLSLVGERGPELVRLPKGSRVHSNQESRKMMSSGGNNITVNINGRVGSSDSELRIIAQKVGKMINKEINRTTSSRSLGA